MNHGTAGAATLAQKKIALLRFLVVALSSVKTFSHVQSSGSHFRRVSPLVCRCSSMGGTVMEWFTKKTSIAGIQLPNWMVVLGAIIVILIIYNSIH
jgi:hypothetical protein